MKNIIKFTVIGIDLIQSILDVWRQFLLPFYEHSDKFDNKSDTDKKEVQKTNTVNTIISPIKKNTHKIESDKIFDREFKRTLKDFLKKNGRQKK